MARGMVVGETIQSQANSEEFAQGYDRIFGDRKPQRGRWVWDEQAQKLVPADEYQPPQRAVDAPIMVDRFYENTAATDGTDIGSRRKHREYMRANGLTTMDDFRSTFKANAEKREAIKQGKLADPGRREAIARALHRIDKP